MMSRLNGIESLIKLNSAHSQAFTDPGRSLLRRQYRANHPTEMAVLECMDGRLNFARTTRTVMGILQQWRNLGGKFDLGWLPFAQSIQNWINYVICHGQDCLMIITYHFSRGDIHRGCRGFNYDRAAAQGYASNLKKQFDRVFGRQALYTILVGIETDFDALILHGDNGQPTVDLANIDAVTTMNMNDLLSRLYPDIPERIRRDLLPLVQGNIAHIAQVRTAQRPQTEIDHCEGCLAVADELDWLQVPNHALIVGPFDPNWAEAISTAASILEQNLRSGRVQGDPVLLTSASYRDTAGFERLLAIEKALFWRDFALNVIKHATPRLAAVLQVLVGTVDMNTRLMTVQDRT